MVNTPSPRSLVPWEGTTYFETQVTDLIFSNLVSASYSGQISPELAERWEISGDKREYTFHLRQNIFFHNGQQSTSDDVIFTFQQLIRSKLYHELDFIEGSEAYQAGRSPSVSGLKRLDALSFKIKLSRNFKYFLEFLAGEYAAILPAGYAGKSLEAFRRSPVGSGPFVFKGESEETRNAVRFRVLHFEKFTRYFNPVTDVETIDFYVLNNRVDIAHKLHFDIFYVTPDESAQVSAQGYRIVNTSYNTLFFIILNPNGNPFLRDPRVRQLIQYAVNREQLVEAVFGRQAQQQAQPAHLLIPFGLLGQNPNYHIDGARAKRLRSELGSTEIRFTLVTAVRHQTDRVAEALKEQLQRYGMQVRVELIMDHFQFFTQVLHQNRDSIILGGMPDYPSPYNFLINLVDRNGLYNVFHVDFPDLSSQVGRLPTLDIVDEAAELQKICARLESEAIYIPLYYFSDQIGLSRQIKSVHFNFGQIIDFTRMEVSDE